MRKSWTEEEVDALKELYWEKENSLKDIANKYNVTVGTVLYHFKKYNISRRTRIDALKLAYKKARRFAHTKKSPRGIHNQFVGSWSEDEDKLAINLIEKGYLLQDIAKILNRTPGALYTRNHKKWKIHMKGTPQWREMASNTTKRTHNRERTSELKKKRKQWCKKGGMVGSLKRWKSGKYPRVERRCKYCGKIFRVLKCQTKGGRKKFCNRKCFEAWWKQNVPTLVQRTPNKKEKKLLQLLREHGFSFNYVGDGKVTINGLCPDFIGYRNKIIELFGDYWHKKHSNREYYTEKGRTSIFQKYGYDLLVIWEHELDSQEEVIRKVEDFVEHQG